MMTYQIKCITCNKVLDEAIEPYKGVVCMTCIEYNLDIVMMSAPKEVGFFNNDEWVSPMNYLIHNLDGYNYLIHRELAVDEINKYSEERIFYYKSKKYLEGIANSTSKEGAESVIKSFWNAFSNMKKN